MKEAMSFPEQIQPEKKKSNWERIKAALPSKETLAASLIMLSSGQAIAKESAEQKFQVPPVIKEVGEPENKLWHKISQGKFDVEMNYGFGAMTESGETKFNPWDWCVRRKWNWISRSRKRGKSKSIFPIATAACSTAPRSSIPRTRQRPSIMWIPC